LTVHLDRDLVEAKFVVGVGPQVFVLLGLLKPVHGLAKIEDAGGADFRILLTRAQDDLIVVPVVSNVAVVPVAVTSSRS
jgi:hypothetical protein